MPQDKALDQGPIDGLPADLVKSKMNNEP
jgi:hypothetical protein